MKLGKLIFVILFISGITLLSISTYLSLSISKKGSTIFEINGERIEVYYSLPDDYNSEFVAIGFHGFMEFPSMFYPIADVLAQQGISFYAISMPGFGRTTLKIYADLKESLSWEILLQKNIAIQLEIINKTIDKIKSLVGAEKVILFGSGMGGGVVLNLNIIRNDIEASIIWGPSGFNDTTIEKLRGKIKNFLYLVGEFDDPRYFKDAVRIMEILGIKNPEKNELYGSFSNGTAKMIKEIELTGSFMIYYSDKTLEAISYWISKSLNIEEAPVGLVYTLTFLKMLSIVLIIFSIFFIPLILSEKLKIFSGGKRWPRVEMTKKAIRMATTWSIAMILLGLILAVVILFGYTLVYRYGILRVEIPLYPIMLVAWSISIWVLTVSYISKFLDIPRVEIYEKVLVEIFGDTKTCTIAIIALAIYYPIFMVWTFLNLIDVLNPNIGLLILYFITLPINLLALLLYEILFRRIIQESFGGATVRAAFITATLSVGVRMIIPVAIALVWLIIGGFLLFSILLLLLLFLIELAIELVAATFYFMTREVLPGALFTVLFWYPTAYIITERVIFLFPI